MIRKFLGDNGRNRCGHSGQGTLKLAVSQEWIDGMKPFLYADTNTGKLKSPW